MQSSGRDGDGDPGNDPEREGLYRGEPTYGGERGFRNRRISPGHALLTERDPRTYRNRADKWGDRAFLVQASDALTNPARPYRSIANLVDTREFPIPVPIALQFRFQTVNTTFANGPGPFVPLASNWLPTPACDCRVRVRRSLGPDGGVSEELYDNTAAGNDGELFLPRVVLAYKVAIDVECLGGFDEVGANSLYVEVWAAPVDTVQPTTLINPAAGDLTGYLFANVSRIPVSVASQDFLFAEVRRRQFIVHNNSTTQSLALGFGVTPSFAAGAELWSVLLPPGAQYEGPIGGFNGRVKGIWNGADAAGEALVTEGRIS